MDAPYRVPPLNYEAEQAVLGAILMNAKKLDEVTDSLSADHFADPTHQMLYRTMLSLSEQGSRIDVITIKDRVSNDAGLQALGGNAYLAHLAAAGQPFGVASYARLIVDLAKRRDLIAIATDLADAAFDLSDPASTSETVQEEAEARLFALVSDNSVPMGAKPISACFDDAVSGIETALISGSGLSGVATGIAALDAMLGGLRRSDLIVLGGRPSMGKTALATNIAVSAAKAGVSTLVFSLEMTATQLTNRIIAAEAGLASNRLEQGRISPADFERVATDLRPVIAGLPLFVDDQAALGVAALRTRARRIARTHGLGLVVIDYLQLIGSGAKRAENRTQEVSDFTRALKALAKELDAPVLVLSQLSRAVEAREDKHPLLSDLRESGSIEQDADVVLFVYRAQYYLERAEPAFGSPKYQAWKDQLDQSINQADIIIAKQRRGPVGLVPVLFNPELTQFKNKGDGA